MINRFMISVAALGLLAGTGFANAQGASDKGGAAGGQTMHQNAQPSGGAAEHGSSMGRQEKGTVGQTGGQSGSMKGQSTEERSSGAMNKNQSAEERGEKAGAKGSRAEEQHGQKSKGMSSENETKGGTKNMKAEGRENNKSAEGREGRTGTNLNAESREGRTGTMNAEGREGRTGTNMNAEGREGRSGAAVTTGQAGAGAKLSTEQRTRITTVIRDQRVAPENNVNFSIAVGTRVPRERVHLHPLPAQVVDIYPEWRGYEFILVHNQIVVVDPRTLEIVAVLEA